jgi:hypothetical protein
MGLIHDAFGQLSLDQLVLESAAVLDHGQCQLFDRTWTLVVYEQRCDVLEI